MHVNPKQIRPDGRQAASGRLLLLIVLFLVDERLCRFHRRMLRILRWKLRFFFDFVGDAGLPPRPAQEVTP